MKQLPMQGHKQIYLMNQFNVYLKLMEEIRKKPSPSGIALESEIH
jgi:hypothetical protein